MNDPKIRSKKKAKKPKALNRSRSTKAKQSKKRKKSYDQIIFRDWCKACGICSSFCPKKIIGRDENGAPVIERPEDCIGCRFCELHCPDFAITIKENSAKSENNSS